MRHGLGIAAGVTLLFASLRVGAAEATNRWAVTPAGSVVPGTMQMIVEPRMYMPLAAVIAGAVAGLHAALSRFSKQS